MNEEEEKEEEEDKLVEVAGYKPILHDEGLHKEKDALLLALGKHSARDVSCFPTTKGDYRSKSRSPQHLKRLLLTAMPINA